MPVSKTRPGLRALKNTIKRLPPYKFGWLLSLKWWQLLSVQEQLVIFCSTTAEGIHPYLWDCVRSVSCEYCWLFCLCSFLCLTQPWVLHLYSLSALNFFLSPTCYRWRSYWNNICWLSFPTLQPWLSPGTLWPASSSASTLFHANNSWKTPACL